MSDALTCPHCDCALLLPTRPQPSHLVCASCGGTLPNPLAAAQVDGFKVAVAIAIDDDVSLGRRHPNFGCFIQLGLVGVVVLAGMIGFGVELLPVPWHASVARLTCSLIGALSIYAVGHALLSVRGSACRQVGWLVLAVYAALGVAGMLACAVIVLLVVAYSLLNALTS